MQFNICSLRIFPTRTILLESDLLENKIKRVARYVLVTEYMSYETEHYKNELFKNLVSLKKSSEQKCAP